jgi:hypothetical protein
MPLPVRRGEHSLSLDFVEAQKTVGFRDGLSKTSEYTVAVATLHWAEGAGPTVEELTTQPIARYSTFPLLVLNACIEAYQKVQRAYDCYPVNVFTVDLIEGEIWLECEDADPMQLRMDHARNRATSSEPASGRAVVARAMRVFSEDRRELPRRIFNRAAKAEWDADGAFAIIGCVTTIETLVSLVSAELARKSGRSEVQVDQTLRAGFRNLVQDHVVPELARRGEHDNLEILREWMATTYGLRNRVVHRADWLIDSESIRASIALTARVADALDSLLSDADV